MLGICRGLQLINVYFGGTLIQDLNTCVRHWKAPEETKDVVHRSRAEKGSWLARLYGESFPHNSAHHQAADLVGSGLVIDSRAERDHVVEALHHEALPVYFVQWHPERMCLAHERPDTVNGLEIFRFFREQCGAGAADCPR